MMIMSHFMILVRDPHHPVPLARSLVRARVSTSLLILLLSCFSASLPLLRYSNNSIGDEGASQIADGLKALKSLTNLNLNL